MAQSSTEASTEASTKAPETTIFERPTVQFELDEGSATEATAPQDDTVYPSGVKLWMSITSLLLTATFMGLDVTVVAVAVPSLTNEFKTINDIGWYSSTYMLMSSSFMLFWSKFYTLFETKRVFLASIFFFQLGSLFCTTAPISAVFILGRAVAGFGGAGLGTGACMIISHSFPLHKRPLFFGICAGVQTISMVAAPLVGGALIDGFSWRACFGINLPFGVLTFLMTAYCYKSSTPEPNPDASLPLRQQLKKLDLFGTLFFVPGIVCLLVALQWGGIRFGWENAKIIVLFMLFAVLIAIFGFIQYRDQENAALPPRVLRQRSVLGGAWFSACCSGILAVTEYYIAIYFQGVRGYSAAKSGSLILPMIIGLGIGTLSAGSLTTAIGYYQPFMILTSVVAPIASGFLTTIDLDGNLVKPLVILGVLGVAVGLGMQAPVAAIQTVLNPKDIPIGIAINGFGGGIGSALFLAASSALFQNRLVAEISTQTPGANMTAFETGGLADVRDHIGKDRLRDVLLGYDTAVTQTLYLPLALGIVSLVGTVAMEQKSMKVGGGIVR